MNDPCPRNETTLVNAPSMPSARRGRSRTATTPATSPIRICAGLSRSTPRRMTRRRTTTASRRSTGPSRRPRQRPSTTCTSTGRRSRTQRSASTSGTTRGPATSCSTRSAALAARRRPPCSRAARPSPSTAARPRLSSPKIIAPPSIPTRSARPSSRSNARCSPRSTGSTRRGAIAAGGKATTGYTVYSQVFQCPEIRCHARKSGVSSPFLPEKMNRHRITR